LCQKVVGFVAASALSRPSQLRCFRFKELCRIGLASPVQSFLPPITDTYLETRFDPSAMILSAGAVMHSNPSTRHVDPSGDLKQERRGRGVQNIVA